MMETRVYIPKEVKIGDKVFKVIEVGSMEDRASSILGRIKYSSQEIHVDVTTPDDGTRNTFLHEILHGIYYDYELEGADEERIVSCMTNGILKMLQDNPEVREMLYHV